MDDFAAKLKVKKIFEPWKLLISAFSSFTSISLISQLVKNPSAVQETHVRFLGREDPLEKEMATRSSILAWKIPWTEVPGGLCPWGYKESDMT